MKNKGCAYMIGYAVGFIAFVCICICVLALSIGGVFAALKLLNWLWFI